MSVDALLAKLQGVRKTGAGRWIAKCPAHEDKRPSLSIRELPDGRILLNDFGGCRVGDVLSALGMEFHDLFPEGAISGYLPRERQPFSLRDVLKCIEKEALVVAVASSNLRQGLALSDADHDRLHVATQRLIHAAELANGHG